MPPPSCNHIFPLNTGSRKAVGAQRVQGPLYSNEVRLFRPLLRACPCLSSVTHARYPKRDAAIQTALHSILSKLRLYFVKCFPL